MNRPDIDNYYLDIAEVVLTRGTCLRRNFGAVIVKNDEVIATGYTGSPRKKKNCCDVGTCAREIMNIPRGQRYELCKSVHAEQNAIISARRQDMLGATLYLVGKDFKTGDIVENTTPCDLCKRFIQNAGISRIVVRKTKDICKDISVYEEE